MRRRYPCGGMHRREFVGAAAASILGASVASAQQSRGGSSPARQGGTLGIPGPYPGRVVEVQNPALKRGGPGDRAAVRATLNRGLILLTGADHPVEAWRTFVQPGEAVGIKVVPNGHPGAHTSPELILEVIEGLKSAGFLFRDMGVFDRSGLGLWRAQ